MGSVVTITSSENCSLNVNPPGSGDESFMLVDENNLIGIKSDAKTEFQPKASTSRSSESCAGKVGLSAASSLETVVCNMEGSLKQTENSFIA